MKKRHFTRLSAFALSAALSVITAAAPFSEVFPITASITASAETGEDSSQSTVTFTAIRGTDGFSNAEGYASLIDGKYTEGDGTKWCCSFFDPYIIFKASEPITLTGYSIVTGNDTESNYGRNPKSWTIYGSKTDLNKDAEGWEEIDKVENDSTLPAENYTKTDFTIKNPTTKKYQYFKMEITAIQNGDIDIMQMAELIPAYKACDHQWTVDHTTDATCTEGSYKIEKCSVCGIEKKTLLEPAKGLNWTKMANVRIVVRKELKLTKQISLIKISETIFLNRNMAMMDFSHQAKYLL